ncbi:uncharacterized protein LOC121385401 [Gigantopelta aegis]|uniref:uncharacterized protein LOC121385401 n=1 Tax=Gigantopelta aegis TaxID=1735272 RepID=UPI001B88CD5F|nr:uncharacterized protein LOC121385401 [Gigantopelta aegis]
MSRRKSKDYRAVFRAIDDLLPQRAAVLEFVADFETGMWKGIREVYPGLPIKGCCFHWNQAVWRKVQELGLAQQYLNDDGTCKFIKKIFALPFLPAEHVEAAFDGLRRATQVPGLVTLLDYVDRTWMRSSVWSVDAWSVFNQSVRTNNDVEGWHHRLNHRALGTAPPFYKLIPMLHNEARLIPLICRFVSERKMRRRQRKAFVDVQGKIFQLWGRYTAGGVSTSRFLSACGKLYAPVAH